ncbi:MAG: AAA family ATPase [Deltaproteobacteria bacterium]|nr:AAA family ATPase [Deltaproteobacteria bacterium]MBW2152533.1 AAA family ATPase [Deltaproteobacteria bacterium]
MIIQKIFINTFGGLSNREIDFQEGMNIILGPNESGKSTVYNAIKNTLFTPSKLTPARFRKQMGHFIPVGGGDTIEISIHFKSWGNKYILSRRWGASVLSSLTLPDGSVLTADDAIQDVIRECLQVPEGTCKTVLMTYQSGLARTVRDIQESRETIESLGDLLRKAVMEMDGISVDLLRAKIEESYNGFFGRWDIDGNYPEGNRGIENPWVMGVGSITKLFYEKEKAMKALEAAAKYERDLDDLNKRISEHARELKGAESYVKNNKILKDDAVKRRQIEAELKGIDLEYEKLEKVNKEWPVAESKINDINKKIPQLEKKEERLKKEREEAESYQKAKALLDQYNRVKKKKEALNQANKHLENVVTLSDEDLNRIRTTFNNKNNLEASLSAGKLWAKFSAKKDIELEIQKGLEERLRIKTRKGEPFDFQADGRFMLSHPEWELEVKSGEVNYEQISEEYKKVKSNIHKLLQKFNVKSLEEAEALNRSYNAALADIKKAKSNLEEELGGLTYEEIKDKVNRLQVQEPGRSLEDILNELAATRAEIQTIKRGLGELEKKLQEYVKDYGNQAKLVERLGELALDRKNNRESLSKLNPLPAEIDDADQFISEYEAVENRLKELTQKHNKLIQERIRLEAQAPDRSVEEIERDLNEAKSRFNAELKKGMAIAKIKETMEALLEEMDSATYKRLEDDVSEFLQKMTGGRYQAVDMKESVPSGFHRKDGVVMPYDFLSTGTKDVLGIALRLAITKQFLGKKQGFVIMDDPLVDLDPDRQSKAANTIKEFAQSKQVILLTCHPSHAKLLGGNLIELNL